MTLWWAIAHLLGENKSLREQVEMLRQPSKGTGDG